eukprot:6593526-Alexandrium_andersonii.AAC.1
MVYVSLGSHLPGAIHQWVGVFHCSDCLRATSGCDQDGGRIGRLEISRVSDSGSEESALFDGSGGSVSSPPRAFS